MERISRFRGRVLLLLFIVLLGFFAFSLYDVQIIQTGGQPADNTTTYTTETRVKAARGEILDSNGNVLVSNRASYDLVLNHYVILSSDGTNANLYRLVKTCDEKGIKYNDHFPTPIRWIPRILSGGDISRPSWRKTIWTQTSPPHC